MNAVAPLRTSLEESFTDQIAIVVEHCKALAAGRMSCHASVRAWRVSARDLHAGDTIVIGKVHKTEHFNILIRGACLIVHNDGTREELRAPCTFVSQPNVQKVLYILEDMIWQTVHVTDETDLAALESILISKEHPELSDEARRMRTHCRGASIT
jgi:hypothetical protein